MELLNIGFGNLISVQRIIAVISPESAPIKRIVQEARDAGKLIDATQGRKTKSVIFTDSEHIILSYLPQEKLQERFNKGEVELFD
jgi:regulator of extracellular matrix RemA (YlzA/DUF370 family)